MRRRIVPFSLCFRSFTSPVPRSFHSGRSFSDANRNSFARLEEERIQEVSLHVETFIKQQTQHDQYGCCYKSHTQEKKMITLVRFPVLLQHSNWETDKRNPYLVTNYQEIHNILIFNRFWTHFAGMRNVFGVGHLLN